MKHEILGDERDKGVCAYQNGNILGRSTSLDKIRNMGYKFLKHSLLIVIIREELYQESALIRFVFRYILNDVSISFL